VTARLAELRAEQRVAYWIVLEYQDGLDLLVGKVPPAVRAQLLTIIKRGRAESTEEYVARLQEARD
jgi:hypothetical protein